MKLNITPFAYKEVTSTENVQIYRWEEQRQIHRVVLRFAQSGRIPNPDELQVSYWQMSWPQTRLTINNLGKGQVGNLGWMAQDDWFNGKWQSADIKVQIDENEAIVTFRPLGRKEFPELKKEYNVNFRRAMKLQIQIPQDCAVIEETQIQTNTNLKERKITVETNCGKKSTGNLDEKIEVYNGVLKSVTKPVADDPRMHLVVDCADPDVLSYDHSIVTIRSKEVNISFRSQDLDEGNPIWVPDLGVLISETKRNLRYSDKLIKSLVTSQTLYDAVLEQPEQSLGRAMLEQQPKDSMHFIVSCEGARQKFGVGVNGDLFASVGYIRRVKGADTPKLGWEGGSFSLRFGWDRWLRTTSSIFQGFVPLLEQCFSNGDLDICQEIFAIPLDQSILDGEIAGDATIVGLTKLDFRNNGLDLKSYKQDLAIENYDDWVFDETDKNAEKSSNIERLDLRGDEIWSHSPKTYFRLLLDTQGKGEIIQEDDELSYQIELKPGESHSIIMKLPFICELTDEEKQCLREKDYETERREMIEYWNKRVSSAAEIITPEPDITDFARSHLTHILINDDFEVGSKNIMGRVSSYAYGNFSNETVMQVLELDRRGLHEEARRHYDTLLQYQGTVALPGNFQSKEGIFYGSGGYECGDYNQHHGWVLWGLAEHYRFTGDSKWLSEIADKLIAGSDWVIRESKATKQTDSSGNKVLEYGFMPAGSLEDVTDFYYWTSTNCLTARGLTAVAEVLSEIEHPQSKRLLKEAKEFKDNLLAGFRESMVRCPVVKLRDGTYVPHFPSRLYWRGRDHGWIREVVAGANNLVTTVLDPNSQESTWILKDYEDNLYCDAPFNYQLEDFDRDWFSRGGFSMQPNLLYFKPYYLFRDQIEHFLRAYFNGFAATFRRDIRAMAEHELPTLYEWDGDHFKSSDEAMTQMWLRMMFILEDNDTLYLGYGLPRAWVGSKDGVAIRNAATYFGPMSLEIRPTDKEANIIIAEITLPTRKIPKKTVLRLRHPNKARLQKVLLNGEEIRSFNASKETIELPHTLDKIKVKAFFAE